MKFLKSQGVKILDKKEQKFISGGRGGNCWDNYVCCFKGCRSSGYPVDVCKDLCAI